MKKYHITVNCEELHQYYSFFSDNEKKIIVLKNNENNMKEKLKPKIWIDADACPRVVKEVVFKAAVRLNLEVCLVANSYMSIPHHALISFIKVDQGADVADNYIVESVRPSDLVITADLPLAGQIVAKNAIAINVRGEVYTEENVSERVSMRDFMQELRDSGMDTGGPPPYSKKDQINFTNGFNRIITSLIKRYS